MPRGIGATGAYDFTMVASYTGRITVDISGEAGQTYAANLGIYEYAYGDIEVTRVDQTGAISREALGGQYWMPQNGPHPLLSF